MIDFCSPVNVLTTFVRLQIFATSTMRSFLSDSYAPSLNAHVKALPRGFHSRWLPRLGSRSLTQMFDVAKVHRDFLESAITSAGSERVRPCNVESCVYFYFVFSPASHGI